MKKSCPVEKVLDHTYVVLIASKFAEMIREDFTPYEWEETLRRNQQYRALGRDCCATHEFCDSNDTMMAAFEWTMGYEPDTGEDFDACLWSAAWEHAHQHYLSRGGCNVS